MTMRELVDRLNETAYAYYVLDNPTISDAEWDALYDELVRREREENTVLPDSPTRRVGGEILPGFTPHRHLSRLWSMDKAQSVAALEDWARRAEKLRGEELPELAFLVEYKFDGLTVNLTYEDGQLTQAATRGNGVVGEGILEQVKTIRSIPLSIPFKGRMEVHGEAYMRFSVLEEYNKHADEPLKNPRNGAAGAIRNLDPSVTSKRRLDASFYDIGYVEGREFETQRDMVAFIREMRLPVASEEVYCTSIQQAVDAVHAIEERRGALDFLIDGAVIKIDDISTQRRLGFTDKFPRFQVAYKFEAEETTSVLREVSWELGRTGKLTPLGHLDPVELAGVTVRRATLNNFGDIERKRLKLLARVWIRRSNDVIPEIMGRVEEYVEGERAIEKPELCPACGSELVERGAHLFCLNRQHCRPQIVGRLAHFASRDAMDIETFSEKTAEQLVDVELVHDPADLYDLKAEQLVGLERFAQKKAENLINAIEASKSRPLDALVFAIGIPNVGKKTARDLAARYGSLSALMEATAEELVRIDEVGDIVAQSVVEYFLDEGNSAHARRLMAMGIDPVWDVPESTGGAFQGMTVVITGTLETMTRQEAEARVVSAGGSAAGSVSKKTGLVVAGEKAGSKRTKAEALGVEVIDEAEFLRRLDGGLTAQEVLI